ncbi:MAG TPA: PatA/PatG family cyanobactin maturation protease [Blastocatellia bacterium]|nr:PatA/PatG family cyanobactin maturation protease [Blastocatellia bacterium]
MQNEKTVPSSAPYPGQGISALPELGMLWAESTGSPKVCVAVLDTLVDLTHPCFDGAKIDQLQTLVPMEVNSSAELAHGTHVASVLVGQHDSPVRGIAPGCRGLMVPVFSSNKGEVSPCSQVDLARAISLAVQQGAHIINISGGQLDSSGEAHPLLANAIRLCAENNILIIAAAGNDGCDCLHIPAAAPTVLVVGAMDSHGSPLDFSNWGGRYRERGILAPGEDILGATPGGGTTLRSGTSFATPIISGIVALFLSIQVERGEKPDPHAACNAILRSAIGCDQQSVPDCSRLLAGRLNVVGALTYLKKGGSMEMSESKSGVPDLNPGSEEQGQNPVGIGVEPKTFATQQPSPGGQAAGLSPPQHAGAAPTVQSLASSATSSVASGQITPSGADGGCGCGGGKGNCSCNGGSKTPQLVYALGEIGFDFVSQARHDSLLQHSGVNVDDPAALLAHLKKVPSSASAVIWTLNIDSTPVYAIQPAGAFAATGYDVLREFLDAQLNEGAERVSVPGYIWGKIPLTCSVTVPIIVPEIRGMYSWTTGALVAALAGKVTAKKEESVAFQKKVAGIQNFLDRVYYEIRNLGVAPQERALNYAATNAFQLEHIYRNAIERGLELDSIEVEKSPICRPESDCWDVKLVFFNPTDRLGQARRVHRFTVDVSDVVPVTVGSVREWAIY